MSCKVGRTMDEEGFRQFLEMAGKKQHVAAGLVNQVQVVANYMANERQTGVDAAKGQDIQAYVETLTQKEIKARMRGLMLYYMFRGNASLAKLAGDIREQEISKTRQSFNLHDVRGVNPEHMAKIEAHGIKSAEQMLAAGRTKKQREALAKAAGVPIEAILELVKLSDLTRLPGVKGIRARLYYDAGVDSIDKMAGWEPEALRVMVTEYVERTRFDGIPPLPKEVSSTVAYARRLPKVVEL